jgi:hypothetical protein
LFWANARYLLAAFPFSCLQLLDRSRHFLAIDGQFRELATQARIRRAFSRLVIIRHRAAHKRVSRSCVFRLLLVDDEADSSRARFGTVTKHLAIIRVN